MDWDFIREMLIALAFPLDFVKITFNCISTSSFSLIINGEPLQCLKAKRGLRQGDPMSSLLFVLGMEYLSRLLKCGSNAPNFKNHPRCRAMQLNHLCFVDGLILFSKGNLQSILIIHSGLKILLNPRVFVPMIQNQLFTSLG